MLNPGSPVPLYRQLAHTLERGIAGGVYPVGSRIPSEPRLAQAHGIGRPTVRQALAFLERQGLIERRRGAGTFVRESRGNVDLFSLAGTLAAFEKEGLAYETRIVDPIRHLEQNHEEGPLSGSAVYRFSRLGGVDNKPLLLEVLWLHAEVFPELHHFQLEDRSLSKLIREHYHLAPSQAQQRFTVVRPSSTEAALLEVSRRDSLLQVDRELLFPGVGVAVCARILCKTAEYAFSQTLKDVQ